jgi:hypothetical protein
VEVVAQHIGTFHSVSEDSEDRARDSSITFSHDQLIFRPGGTGDAVVGLDKLARLRARVASDGIARWRREDAVH